MTRPLHEEAALEGALDWGRLDKLRLRARTIAEGLYSGAHRSQRRGPGVEFAGHRPYVAGDDLRFLDPKAALRHDKLLVREFETDTERSLHLLLDASASMGFRGPAALASKLAYASVVAAALSRVTLAAGDAVALDWLFGKGTEPLRLRSGLRAFEQVLHSLERARVDATEMPSQSELEGPVARVAHRSRRGAVVVVLSDLLDLPAGSEQRLAELGTRGRHLLLVQLLDPLEARFGLEGPVRLRSPETQALVETNATVVRSEYLAALEALTARYAEQAILRHGQLVRVVTDEDPLEATRKVLHAIEGVSA